MNRDARVTPVFRRMLAGLALAIGLQSAPTWAACTAANPNANVVEATPTADFTDNGNGTVTHAKTGLMWKQCAEGLNGAGCATGAATAMTWSAALAAAASANTANFAGHADWRLPNIRELQSIVETCGHSPAINLTLFPATPASNFWSASTYVPVPANAWLVYFGDGDDDAHSKAYGYYARLVRGGQLFDSFDLLSPVNGACDATNHGQTLTAAPSTNLCAAGSAGAVSSGNTSYDWSCTGANGGSDASCSATRNYVVTSSVSGGNGTVSASQNVAYNATPSFTLTPDAGYTSGPVTGTCGGSLSGNTYTANAVTASCTVVAGFTLKNYTVTPSAGAGGSLSPATPQTVNHGNTTSFTVTPDAGYGIGTVSGCGGSFSGSTYTTGSVTGACTVTASFTATPVNGACGSASGVTTAFMPASNLCSAGAAGSVTVAGNFWNWSCTGTNGGTNAACSAPTQPTPTTGNGSAAVSGGTWAVDTASSAGFIPVTGNPKSPPSLPLGVTFPYGLFDFTLITGTPGTAATITITYPAALPAGSVYWKYGPSPDGYNCSGAACNTAHWYQMPPAQAIFAGNTVTLTIIDGGVGDDDLTANGIIIDQGGPGVPGGAAGVPTLSEWAMLALIGLMGLIGARRAEWSRRGL
jgi:hypothetical protein